jgi:hypothetical protein
MAWLVVSGGGLRMVVSVAVARLSVEVVIGDDGWWWLWCLLEVDLLCRVFYPLAIPYF